MIHLLVSYKHSNNELLASKVDLKSELESQPDITSKAGVPDQI